MPTPSTLFLCAAGVSALVAIWAEERRAGRHPAFYLLKPLTTLLILGAAATAPGADEAYRNWICAALLLSTAGDIALTREGDRAFMAGLGSFLVAHGLFVWAFLLATAYAATDEVHQAFVPNRGPSPFDVLIDASGAATALLAYRLLRRYPLDRLTKIH